MLPEPPVADQTPTWVMLTPNRYYSEHTDTDLLWDPMALE